jgi:hypothetical protein
MNFNCCSRATEESFVSVGILAGVRQAQRSYPEFGQGAVGYGRYYWHSLMDLAFVPFALVTSVQMGGTSEGTAASPESVQGVAVRQCDTVI